MESKSLKSCANVRFITVVPMMNVHLRLISWPWEITFVPLWIVLCISLVGVLYTIIFAGVILRLPEVHHDQRRSSTSSALGNDPGNGSSIRKVLVFVRYESR